MEPFRGMKLLLRSVDAVSVSFLEMGDSHRCGVLAFCKAWGVWIEKLLSSVTDAQEVQVLEGRDSAERWLEVPGNAPELGPGTWLEEWDKGIDPPGRWRVFTSLRPKEGHLFYVGLTPWGWGSESWPCSLSSDGVILSKIVCCCRLSQEAVFCCVGLIWDKWDRDIWN